MAIVVSLEGPVISSGVTPVPSATPARTSLVAAKVLSGQSTTKVKSPPSGQRPPLRGSGPSPPPQSAEPPTPVFVFI